MSEHSYMLNVYLSIQVFIFVAPIVQRMLLKALLCLRKKSGNKTGQIKHINIHQKYI